MPKRVIDGRHGVKVPSACAVIAAFGFAMPLTYCSLLFYTAVVFLHHGIASAEAVNVCRHLPPGLFGAGRTEPPPAGFPRAQPGYHRAAAFRFGFCIKKTAGRCFPLSGRGASHALFLFFLSAFAALFAACSSAASFAFSVISRAFSRFAFALASFFSSLPRSSAFPASSARVVR